ncbi:TPA: hypothetical protein DIC20_03010 [Candidatus Dependentiae bacterium]|nr:MAG: von Willebrand factor type A [candidate division TM6 bacterium GW2011_GWF2_36_131]KKQ02528.1 MAG: von Willebrand factor type A [candidate division TM6 bacterium GW2011_GWE2_36_25]KKQ19274.1 MAG: von Willebrand factor type A [candidate division TM6 bacterium GW2011_GWA2_36_9]HBR70117.1 hypothetical protein [Candidatus Dependentiae bacterium]HCU00645.1 hypothetical protein [Candidatus Dependentiae bacterium]
MIVVSWGNLHNLWMLFLAVFLIALVWWKYLSRNKLAILLNKHGSLLRHFSAMRNVVKASLSSIAILFLFLALLHPKWGVVEEVVEQEGRDLFIALDVSRSMLTQDVTPDRLSCAKQALKSLINQLATDRVGLIIFSEKARVYCPLTQDKELIQLFLDQIDHTTIGAGTTLLDQPVQLTIEQCKRTPDKKSRLLVLVTDGEDFSKSLEALKKQAKEVGLTILVIGIGTCEGGPIPLYDEQGKRAGYVKDKKDQVVISQLHQEGLRSLTQETGGAVIFVQNNQVDMREIVHKIEQFEKERQGERAFASLQEQYPWFLLISFICFLIEWLL